VRDGRTSVSFSRKPPRSQPDGGSSRPLLPRDTRTLATVERRAGVPAQARTDEAVSALRAEAAHVASRFERSELAQRRAHALIHVELASRARTERGEGAADPQHAPVRPRSLFCS
jgi:hypothetical protein